MRKFHDLPDQVGGIADVKDVMDLGVFVVDPEYLSVGFGFFGAELNLHSNALVVIGKKAIGNFMAAFGPGLSMAL